ncbi:MAG TPA: glycosyltransferase family 4 protein [Terriglobales bacterium]|nr:glycosyltransferase family 4 protein [Terriglobales bacterium]
MSGSSQPVRVLYSFPHILGAGRICYTAWQQANGLAAAGADVLVFPGVLHRPLPASVAVRPTLARSRWRIPYRLLGTLRACALHDCIVARRLEGLAGKIDVVHAWPLAALRTVRAAARLGIPSVLERPNAHTRFAYQVVQQECERLGLELPPDHEHAWNPAVLAREEEEYRQAYRLLCPSDFVVQTFLQQGFLRERLLRHEYGFDETTFYPDDRLRPPGRGLTVLFAGVCAVRKGLHFALEAWLRSPAHLAGAFLIAGEFLPAYARKLAYQLSQPSVRVLGDRKDLPDLMRQSDVLVLPSIEEGYGLVCAEAMGSGCVPLVSDACTEICVHMGNALVHRVGDVETLTRHLTMLHQDRSLLQRLRAACLCDAPHHTWTAAGVKLLQAYRQAIAEKAADAVPSGLQLCA